MVKPATALGRTGLQDWIIQRATAIILAVYTAYLFILSRIQILIMKPGIPCSRILGCDMPLCWLCSV